MLFSELWKIVVNKVIVVCYRRGAIVLPLDPPLQPVDNVNCSSRVS